jgi:hypothetical protein
MFFVAQNRLRFELLCRLRSLHQQLFCSLPACPQGIIQLAQRIAVRDVDPPKHKSYLSNQFPIAKTGQPALCVIIALFRRGLKQLFVVRIKGENEVK